jgi:hypothetical protein
MKYERFIQVAGWLCVLAGLVGCIMGIWANANPTLTLQTSQAFVFAQITYVFMDSAFLVSVIALALSGLAGNRGLAKTGLSLALVGRAVSVIGEVMMLIQFDLGKVLLSIVTMVIGIGMLLVGIAVMREAVWQGWGKFTPLLCGLYVFLVLMPAFGVSGGPNFLALAGMGLIWAAYGLALANRNFGTTLVQNEPSTARAR